MTVSEILGKACVISDENIFLKTKSSLCPMLNMTGLRIQNSNPKTRSTDIL